MDRYYEAPNADREEYLRKALYGLASRLEFVTDSVSFEIEYTLYYFAHDFDVIRDNTMKFQEFREYIRRLKDVSELIPFVDLNTPWGGFCKALVATQSEEGLFPIAYKFLVEYDWFSKVNISEFKVTTYNRTLGGLMSLSKACNYTCSLDLRRVMVLFNNIVRIPSNAQEVAESIYKKAMELTDDTSFDNMAQGTVNYSIL
jgi:hypothetical protein